MTTMKIPRITLSKHQIYIMKFIEKKIRKVKVSVVLVGLVFVLGGGMGYEGHAQSSIVLQISGGDYHTCALLNDSSIKCWGSNYYGQLGNGTTISPSLPVTVSGITNAIVVSAGDDRACALLVDGSVKCWGDNYRGRLGDGTTNDSSVPVTVSGITDAIAVELGDYHSCAVITDGSIRCWGSNSFGKLGNETTNDSSVPVTVSGITNAIAVSAGRSHTCALLANGSIKCWGYNRYAQLGDGTFTNRSAPVTVSGITNAIAVSAGGSHTCALLVNNNIKCWGGDGSGQLGTGDGKFVGRRTPAPVYGIINATAISVGSRHSCALLDDGSIKCWGNNYNGELGDGTAPDDKEAPVTVFGITNAVVVNAGSYHGCSVLDDGGAKCWGNNYNGALGDGTTADRSTPVFVTGLSGNVVPTEDTATVIVSTEIINDNGGNNTVSDFSLRLRIGDSWDEVLPRPISGISQQVSPGFYTFNTGWVGGYTVSFGGDCNADGKIELSLNDSKVCNIIYNDLPATITLIKKVINDDGGMASPTDFGLRIDGNLVSNNTTITVNSNSPHFIGEDGLTGYSFMSITDTFPLGELYAYEMEDEELWQRCPINMDTSVTLDEGEAITCTITNDDTDTDIINLKIEIDLLFLEALQYIDEMETSTNLLKEQEISTMYEVQNMVTLTSFAGKMFNNTLELFEDMELTSQILLNLINKSRIYYDNNDYELSKIYLERAKVLFLSLDYTKKLAYQIFIDSIDVAAQEIKATETIVVGACDILFGYCSIVAGASTVVHEKIRFNDISSEAVNDLATSIVIEIIFNHVPIDELGGKTLSDGIAQDVNNIVQKSDVLTNIFDHPNLGGLIEEALIKYNAVDILGELGVENLAEELKAYSVIVADSMKNNYKSQSIVIDNNTDSLIFANQSTVMVFDKTLGRGTEIAVDLFDQKVYFGENKNYFDFLPHIWNLNTNMENETFSVEVTFNYSSDELAKFGIQEDSLSIYLYDENQNTWLTIPSYVNTANSTISFNTTHFSIYTVGQPVNRLETQIAITKMEYDEGNDILSAVTADVGDNQAPLLLSELKESTFDLEDYTSNGKLESGQKKKLKMKFKFLETAGNEYQGKSINVKFKFLGTQEEH